MTALHVFDDVETGDVKLCFHDGRCISAHGAKLASLGGCLQIIMEEMMGDQIAAMHMRSEEGRVH